MTGVAQRTVPPGSGRTPSRRWLVWIALLLCGAAVLWLVAFSPVLGVSTVSVRGNKLLSAQQIRQAAAIRNGTPLVRLDTAAAERRIAALPAVSSVKVSTSYPSSVSITVVERVAVGYRSTASGIVVVDAGNVAFRQLAGPPHLPQLVESGNDDADRAMATVAGALTRAVVPLVAKISAVSSESVTLSLFDGRTVLWGGTDHSVDKGRLLGVLVKQPGTYFDISDPGTVISRGGNG